jgi:hypothetical protein
VGIPLWRKVLGYAPLVLGVLLLPTFLFLRGWWLLGVTGAAIISWWLVLRNTLDLVQGVGSVYWLTRQTTVKRLAIQTSFMRETDYPWRTGRGIQAVVPYRTFQVGVCKPSEHYTKEEGLLHSLVGRSLTSKPEEIRTWH